MRVIFEINSPLLKLLFNTTKEIPYDKIKVLSWLMNKGEFRNRDNSTIIRTDFPEYKMIFVKFKASRYGYSTSPVEYFEGIDNELNIIENSSVEKIPESLREKLSAFFVKEIKRDPDSNPAPWESFHAILQNHETQLVNNYDQQKFEVDFKKFPWHYYKIFSFEGAYNDNDLRAIFKFHDLSINLELVDSPFYMPPGFNCLIFETIQRNIYLIVLTEKMKNKDILFYTGLLTKCDPVHLSMVKFKNLLYLGKLSEEYIDFLSESVDLQRLTELI